MRHEDRVAPARRWLSGSRGCDGSGAPGRGGADVVAVLVAFVAGVHHGVGSVRRHPRTVIDGHQRRNDRTVNVLDHVGGPESAYGPATEAVIDDFCVDEVKVVGVVERDVALVAYVQLVWGSEQVA